MYSEYKLYPQDFTSKWFQINDCYVFAFPFLFPLQTVALCSLQYFSIKTPVNFCTSLYFWCLLNPRFPESTCFACYFFSLSISSNYWHTVCPFSSSNGIGISFEHRNITYISIVCCCGILLPRLDSTCRSLIGCIFFAFYLPSNLFSAPLKLYSRCAYLGNDCV